MGVAVMVEVSYWHRGTSARSLGTEPMGLIVWIVSHGSIFHYPIIIHSLLIRHKRGRSPNLKLNYPVIFARFLDATGNFFKVSMYGTAVPVPVAGPGQRDLSSV